MQAPGHRRPARPARSCTAPGCSRSSSSCRGGGCVVTLESRNLDVEELLDTVERERVNTIAIVGDAFAKPMLRALDAEPGRWDLSSLFVITVVGRDVQRGDQAGPARATTPAMMIVDAFSLVRGARHGPVGVDAPAARPSTAKFTLGENTRVITDDGRDVEPGSGEIGRVAVGGYQPVGYYKDEEKSAATFLTIDGERYSIPGDYATVEADGIAHPARPRARCASTPAARRSSPRRSRRCSRPTTAVADAVAVGVPDEKFGEAITAVVELAPGADARRGRRRSPT